MNRPQKHPLVVGPLLPPCGGSTASPDDGYGRQPRCITCRKGVSNCFCDDPEIDVPSARDVSRIMDQLYPDSGWGFSERCEIGMAK